VSEGGNAYFQEAKRTKSKGKGYNGSTVKGEKKTTPGNLKKTNTWEDSKGVCKKGCPLGRKGTQSNGGDL